MRVPTPSPQNRSRRTAGGRVAPSKRQMRVGSPLAPPSSGIPHNGDAKGERKEVLLEEVTPPPYSAGRSAVSLATVLWAPRSDVLHGLFREGVVVAGTLIWPWDFEFPTVRPDGGMPGDAPNKPSEDA
jgi:hypothetical protein